MATDVIYFPSNGQYWPVSETIYAQYRGECPNPCRKYHISSDLAEAEYLARIVLPYLIDRGVFHKVVRSKSLLAKQMAGQQAGKFITMYMPAHVEHRNTVITELGILLRNAHDKGLAVPGPTIPRSRPYRHVFIETPIDETGFIYGGSIVDPTR